MWQQVVDTLAEVLDVPSALIMKGDYPYIEVFRSSNTENNPYRAGDREQLAGLYCDEVMRRKDRLLVSNALNDPKWANNPDIELGMVSYLGFPLLWADGDVFGTICVLDSKENSYNKRYEDLVLVFKEVIESHLDYLFKSVVEMKNLEDILDNLAEGIIAHDMDRHILFFNRAAEEITGYSRKEVLGRDCHVAFGEPFCGGRCSFKEGRPVSVDHRPYPMNIVTKDGTPRRINMKLIDIRGSSGEISGVIASFRDVTDVVGFKIQLGELKGFAGIVGRDIRMLQVYRQIRDLSTTDYPVCITGETGTGKEIVAAAIHNESRRGGGPFVPVNCAALPEGVLESELFGHVKGAFTGAVRDKKGRFELADKGTLFLDEVGDLPRVVQAKLLRVIQEGVFERVGAEKPVVVDVRIISATNKDLKQEVVKGNFRDDLYYRLNVVPMNLPPLRERRGDIPLLVEHFLGEALEEGQESQGFSNEALELMKTYSWPGNVRELQSAIRFALVKSRSKIIKPEHLPVELRDWRRVSSNMRGPIKKLNRESVRAALRETGGNKAKAARILGVGRATLYRFLGSFPDVS